MQPSSSIVAAAATGHRELLVALRTNIAEAIDDGVPPRDLAALSRRLLDIAAEIDAIDAGKEGDDVGDAASTPDAPWPVS
jgi:hypothetical protein